MRRRPGPGRWAGRLRLREARAGHRGGAGPRGPGPGARGRGLQPVHHPRAEPEDHARQGLLQGPGGEARQRALRRLHQGLRRQEGRARQQPPGAQLRRPGQPGQRVPPEGTARGRLLRLPAAPALLRGVHPPVGQRGPAGPDRRLDAALRVPAAEHREPPAGDGHRGSGRGPDRASSANRCTSSSTSRAAAPSGASDGPVLISGAGWSPQDHFPRARPSTIRAAGAAVAPPAPLRTNSTPTASLGRLAGRRR